MNTTPTLYQYHVFVSFSDLFPEEEVPSVLDIIRHYPRPTIIQIACTIGQFYGEGEVERYEIFFSPKNRHQWVDIQKRFKRFISTAAFPNAKYYFSSFVTGLELLRYSYSIPPVQDENIVCEEEFEWQLFRAILIINQNTICRFKSNHVLNKYQLVYLNNLCYVDIGKDLETLLFQQLVYSYYFFIYLENDKGDSHTLLDAFESKYAVSWREYVLTVVSLYILLRKEGTGKLNKNLKIDKTGTLKINVLEKISIPSTSVFKYSSDNKDYRTGNSDYRFFRESPLVDEGDSFFLHSPSIVLGKLYNSLYFDFAAINQALPKEQRIGNVPHLFQEDFIQNNLLITLTKQICDKRSRICTESSMKRLSPQKREKELGPPDLLVVSHKNVILFECKDIRLNGWVKEQKDYELIIQELEGKIIGLRDNHKGIGQLSGHLKSIRDGVFPWEKVSPGKKVYPVLILSDPSIIQDGLYGIVSDKYEESLRINNVRDIAANRPIILMSVFTLYKYSDWFRKNGLVYYFERYYRYLNSTGQKETSFDQYMGWHCFNMRKQTQAILADLRKDAQSRANPE